MVSSLNSDKHYSVILNRMCWMLQLIAADVTQYVCVCVCVCLFADTSHTRAPLLIEFKTEISVA
jgi:hypothetical protein